jgi:hypothetical protein
MYIAIATILILVASVYRVVMGFAAVAGAPEWLHNFAPLAAIALCGGFYLPKRLALVVPFVAMVLSDVILNVFRYNVGLFYPGQILGYVALGLVIALGLALRASASKPSLMKLLGGSVVASLVFYLVTSTGSWLTNPVYAKTAAGWLQACTMGDPSFTPPAWTFFRNSAVSDLIYTTLFFACMFLTQRQFKAGWSRSSAELSGGSEGWSMR